MRFKKITALLMAMSMVAAVLAGCGGNSGGNKKDADNGTTGERIQAVMPGHEEWAEGVTVCDVPDDQKDITVLMSAGWDYWETMHSEEDPEVHVVARKIWEETVGGTVNIQVVTETEQVSYLSSAIATDTAPDIIANFFPRYSIVGFTEDLSDEKYADYLDWDNDELWNKGISGYYVWNDEWSGLFPNIEHDPWVVVYNKTKFEAAGEKTPIEYYKEGNWTWTQFVQTAKNMTDVTNNEYGYIGLYLQPSVDIRLNEEGHFYLDTNDTLMRKNTEIYNFFQGSGHPARCSTENMDFRNAFAGGKDAMTIMGKEEYERLITTTKETGGDEFGLAPMFSWDVCGETTPVLKSPGWSYTICSASNSKIGAAAYINLEAQVYRHLEQLRAEKEESGGLIYYTEEETKALEDVYKLMDEQTFEPLTRTYTNLPVSGFSFDDIMYNSQSLSMQALVDQGKPAAQADIDKLNKTIDLYLKEE